MLTSNNIKILTNHPGHSVSLTWKERTHYIYSKKNPSKFKKKSRIFKILNSIRFGIKMFRLRNKYKVIVLGGGLSDRIFALLQSFYYFRRTHIIKIDCLWYKKSNSILRALKRIEFWLEDKSIDLYVVWAKREIKAYSQEFGINEEKFKFIPYHTTTDGFSFKIKNDGYLFSGGNFARDYETLIKAVKNLPLEVIIACNKKKTFEGIEIPSNVKIVCVSHQEFLQLMAGSFITVISLIPGLLHSGGQQTFLNAMAMGKPVIVNDPNGACDYIENWKNGILISPCNYHELRRVIKILMNNKTKADKIGKEAKKVAVNLTTEKNLASIVKLSEDLVNKRRRC